MNAQLASVLLLTVAMAEKPADCVCRTKVRIGGPCASAAAPVPIEQFDHARFSELLARFVDCRGRVCYRSWKADCGAMSQLHDYLASLACVDVARASKHPKHELAFYINSYNALVIWGILKEYPTPSIQTHNKKGACYRIFDDLEVYIGDKYLSLNAIEHDILRSLHEPRIHFALVCAAKSCPKLRNEAYAGERLDEQLTENADDFFSHRDRCHICRPFQTVYISPILKWFAKDFGETKTELLATIAPFLRPKDCKWVARHPCPHLKYLGYDWALNDQCSTFSVRLGGIPYTLFARFEPRLDPLLRVTGLRTEQTPAAENNSETGESSAEGPQAKVEPPAAPAPKVLSPPAPAPRALTPEAPEDPAPPKPLTPKSR